MEKDHHQEDYITLVCSEKQWNSFLFMRGNYFRILSYYLTECYGLIEYFTKNPDHDFPPSFDFMAKTLKKELPLTPLKPDHTGYEKFVAERLSNMMFGYDDIEKLEDDLNDFFDNGFDNITKLSIKDSKSLWRLGIYSFLMAETFYMATHFGDTRKGIIFIVRYQQLSTALQSVAWNAIGYWEAKMEEKKRNLKSVRTRTKKLMENVEIIGKMLEDSRFLVDRDFISKAMMKTGRYERTVKNMIKEVIKKKDK